MRKTVLPSDSCLKHGYIIAILCAVTWFHFPTSHITALYLPCFQLHFHCHFQGVDYIKLRLYVQKLFRTIAEKDEYIEADKWYMDLSAVRTKICKYLRNPHHRQSMKSFLIFSTPYKLPVLHCTTVTLLESPSIPASFPYYFLSLSPLLLSRFTVPLIFIPPLTSFPLSSCLPTPSSRFHKSTHFLSPFPSLSPPTYHFILIPHREGSDLRLTSLTPYRH